MSGLELNKIVAAILLSSLIAMLVGFTANILYKPKLQPDERGYQIEVSEMSTNVAAEEQKPLDIAELMSKANAAEGQKIIKKCISCHSFDKGGSNKIGPNLWNIVNGPTAHRQDFVYSKALSEYKGKWNIENLFAFLHKPSKFIPGTKMSFIGLSKPEDIANVIAYLQQNSE
ncbi:MAG: cytochrome c family protein [Rickettsiaceae bacterium]|nr:cytochrome c family protein [Rickettsiaceae bacterium]